MTNLLLELQALREHHLMQTLYTFAKQHETQLYLVGGSVRDLLLNRPTTDFDFTMESNAIQFAKLFADSIQAPIIRLEEQPPTARVIIKNTSNVTPQFSLDFTQYRASSLIDDLYLRDLTINAMAIPLESVMESNQPEIIDPCQGKNDIKARHLQFPSEKVLLDDPLRLIRVYRFAAYLDFHLTENAKVFVKRNTHLLPQVSKERIRDELLKILHIENSTCYLQQMSKIGLLRYVLPVLVDEQVDFTRLEKFEKYPIPTTLHSDQNEINMYLNEEIGFNANRRSLIKLCLLLQGNLRKMDKLLRLSKKASQFMHSLVTGHRQLADRQMTKKETINFLRNLGCEWWGVLLFSTAVDPISVHVLQEIKNIYHYHLKPIIRQGRLVTGKDLIEQFQLKEGRQIGMILKLIEERQFYGEIRSREEALAAVKELICEGDVSL